jgi:hypothetical protein
MSSVVGRLEHTWQQLWRQHRRVLTTGISDAAGRLCGYQVVTVVGDSHARVFNEIHRRHLVPRTWFHVVAVSGATALGLANPNSRTDALGRFGRGLRRVPRSRAVVVMLGEVDCGFLAWYLADERGTTVDVELARSRARYVQYLEGLLADGRSHLCLVSAILPTVDDYTTWAGLDNERRTVTADMAERTAATLAYNAEMRAWAADHGCAYLDLDAPTLDPTTGLVADAFRNPDPLDHHLSRGPLAAAIAAQLVALGRPIGASAPASA